MFGNLPVLTVQNPEDRVCQLLRTAVACINSVDDIARTIPLPKQMSPHLEPLPVQHSNVPHHQKHSHHHLQHQNRYDFYFFFIDSNQTFWIFFSNSNLKKIISLKKKVGRWCTSPPYPARIIWALISCSRIVGVCSLRCPMVWKKKKNDEN